MSDKTEFTGTAVPPEDKPEDKRPCLVMIKGDFIGQVYDLTKDVTMIGRSDDVDLVISDISISRKHAMIVHRADGFYLSDLGSTNGCWVNKDRAGQPLRMNEGDKVTLGTVVFKFSYQDDDDTQYHLMLRNMAVKDGLTRIYNKRYFTETLAKECDYNRRTNNGLALVLFDIDHFKVINDTYGHPAGDFILKHLAALVEDDARGYDVFARYGGEEFALILRGTTLDETLKLADRVRQEIAEFSFDYDDVSLKVTVSLGVAWSSGDDDIATVESLVAAADKRLYEAKSAGRNCVRPSQSVD